MDNQSTQWIEKIGWRIIKWTLGIVVTLGFLGGIFWAIFYWDYTANLTFIIPARIWYQNIYWQVEGRFVTKRNIYPPYDPIYTIQSVGTLGTTSNHYIFIGNFASIDIYTETMRLKGSDGKLYNFNVSRDVSPIQNQANQTVFLPMLSIYKYLTDDARRSESGIIDAAQMKFLTTDQIEVKWADNRSLYQIFNDYRKNIDTPINLNSQTYLILLERGGGQ